MSNYGNPNGNRNSSQSAPASSGQSPYMGYQQNAYQTGPNQSPYRNGSNAGNYPVNQNSTPYQNPYQGYNQNPYQAAGQNQPQGYTGNTQNPYARPGQVPYVQGQYVQSTPTAGGNYVPYGNQQPYTGAQPGYASGPNGPQVNYPGMQTGPQGGYPGSQPGYFGPQGGMQQGYGYQGGMAQPGYGTANGPYPGQGPQGPNNMGRGYGINNNGQGPMTQQPVREGGGLGGLDLSRILPIAGGVLLVAFFALSLFISAPVLKWIFLVLAAASLAGIWLRPVLAQYLYEDSDKN